MNEFTLDSYLKYLETCRKSVFAMKTNYSIKLIIALK